MKAKTFVQATFLCLFLVIPSCGEIAQEEPPLEDCKYSFINQPIGFCGFDFDKIPYCTDCPDEEGKLGTYNILIDQPNDKFNDAVPLRPTILAVHGYLPNTNEPNDPWGAWALNLMRENFCKYGYTVASLEYRQDIKDFSEQPICEIPEMEIIKTHYRAIQDLRKAIDRIYQNPADYGIDIDNLFLLGNSQGGMTVLNGMLAKDENEWLATFPSEFGNIKNELGPWKDRRPIKGIISVAGSVYDLDFLDQTDNMPLFLAHGVCDNAVPYKTGTYYDCTTTIKVHGSYEIACKANQLNKPYSLHSVKGLGHDWTDEKNDEITIKIRNWIKDQVICGDPKQEEFTSTASEVNCPETSTSVTGCN